MNRLFRKLSRKIRLSIAASIVSSISILGIAFIGKELAFEKLIQIIFPIIFWVGTIIEQAMIWSANSIRVKLEAEGKLRRIRGRPGALSILQTEEGAITDIIIVVLIIVFVILLLFNLGKGLLQYLFISFIVLAFRLHCIFNGKNFRYKKYLAKRSRSYEDY